MTTDVIPNPYLNKDYYDRIHVYVLSGQTVCVNEADLVTLPPVYRTLLSAVHPLYVFRIRSDFPLFKAKNANIS
jgi:hypothetical protein